MPRMGLYVADGRECSGRPTYVCSGCTSDSTTTLYYDDGLSYWFIGPNGCGSYTVGLYAPDASLYPEMIERSWLAWDGSLFASQLGIDVDCVGDAPSATPTATPTPVPTALPSLAPSTAAPTVLPTPAPSALPSTAVPSTSPCENLAITNHSFAPQAGRMGVYVRAGDCDGRFSYSCIDCDGVSAVYFDADIGYWFLGPNGCGSRTAGAYVDDDVGDPSAASRSWMEWNGEAFVASAVRAECLGPRPSASPVPVPTTVGCSDSTSWYFKKAKYTCATKVADDPEKYCKSKYVDEHGVTSEDACPRSCALCSSSSACDAEDSTSWYFKKAKYTCQNKVADDPEKYCKSKYVDEHGVSSAQACAAICGGCVDSTSWFFKKAKYTCGTKVADDPEKYCKPKYVDDSGIASAEACARSCA